MAIVPDQSTGSALDGDDFGANDWLLEEMYEQYTADPSSVDESWVSYFKTHGAPGDGGDTANEPARPAPAAERTNAPDPGPRPRARPEPADRRGAGARPGPGQAAGCPDPQAGRRPDPIEQARHRPAYADRRDHLRSQGEPPDRARRPRRSAGGPAEPR